MYQVFLGYLPLPIAPSRINTVVNGKNETIELLNGQEVNIIKPTGLTEISFEFLIPHQGYPFATFAGQLANLVGKQGGRMAYEAMGVALKQYLEYLKSGQSSVVEGVTGAVTNLASGNFSGALDSVMGTEKRVTKGEPFQFIVVDVSGNSVMVKNNLKVTLENYEIIEDADAYGLDTLVSVTLKEYVPYSTKILGNDGKITKTRGK